MTQLFEPGRRTAEQVLRHEGTRCDARDTRDLEQYLRTAEVGDSWQSRRSFSAGTSAGSPQFRLRRVE